MCQTLIFALGYKSEQGGDGPFCHGANVLGEEMTNRYTPKPNGLTPQHLLSRSFYGAGIRTDLREREGEEEGEGKAEGEREGRENENQS